MNAHPQVARPLLIVLALTGCAYDSNGMPPDTTEGSDAGDGSPSSAAITLDVTRWYRSATRLRVEVDLANDGGAPLDVEPSQFSVETEDGLTRSVTRDVPASWLEPPCEPVTIHSSRRLVCQVFVRTTTGDRPARLHFAGPEGRGAEAVFPDETRLQPSEYCDHGRYYQDECETCTTGCPAVASSCAGPDDRENLTRIAASRSWCAAAAAALSAACFDAALACAREVCEEECQFHP